jgi:hypothetical protein
VPLLCLFQGPCDGSDALALILAQSDCYSALELSKTNRLVRELMQTEFFWRQVAKLKGLTLEPNESAFTAYFMACYEAERAEQC